MGKEYTSSRVSRRQGKKSRLRVKVQNATRSTVSRTKRGDFSGRIK